MSLTWEKIRIRLVLFLKDSRYLKMREIFLFILLTILIHFAWRFWMHKLNYFPVLGWMNAAVSFTIEQLFYQTGWILQHIFQIPCLLARPVIWFANTWGVSVNEGCSGFKQMAQFILLMIFFPGSWKRKAWFIPLGIIILYITNLLRITTLGLALNYDPRHIHFLHDYVLRSLFYIVIFILWLAWVNKLNGRRNQEGAV
jgi:exosortase/archaeosortase family protein